MSEFNAVGVVGAGNYGMAIAQCFSKKVLDVLLISNLEASLDGLNERLRNITSNSECRLADNIGYTDDFSRAGGCALIFIAVPAAAVADVCRQIRDFGIDAPLVICSKGFDGKNGRLLSAVVEEMLPNQFLVLSGPSFAGEIARGLPAAVNVAGKDHELSERVAVSLSSDSFKIKPIDDYIGLQVSGAMKNALAVGCGILSGLNLGESAVAQFIVNGFREMGELALALGGRRESFWEVGGLGDVVLTCTSRQSRNIALGKHLAVGGDLDSAAGCLAEGVFTIKAVPVIEKKNGVKLPLFSELHSVVYGNRDLRKFSVAVLK
ncbi:MAG: NAD(P)H-dependent glycerol-3-phosphate dehydrogenase [Holosporaceae bacterium]|jgi:glycerol-3-phosphate dehydrogenase (NAD(P)+)|nr:NAD(P)H-dependent glycerol-3-phosphate dehydrogenase [Holosporaceae bacterium]